MGAIGGAREPARTGRRDAQRHEFHTRGWPRHLGLRGPAFRQLTTPEWTAMENRVSSTTTPQFRRFPGLGYRPRLVFGFPPATNPSPLCDKLTAMKFDDLWLRTNLIICRRWLRRCSVRQRESPVCTSR